MEHLETSNPIISIMLSSMDNYLPTTSPNIKEPNSNLIKMLLEINLSKKSLSIIWLKEMMALNPSITSKNPLTHKLFSYPIKIN
jgi:hypothetical protein